MIFLNIILIWLFAGWAGLYAVSFGIYVYKDKNRSGAVAVWIIALSAVTATVLSTLKM